MSFIVVDVEADGEIPNKYSMVCFGAVVVEPTLSKTFYGRVKPISPNFNPEALAISGFSRQEHETFDDPKKVMEDFEKWVQIVSVGRPIFISDNVAFDWMWVAFYFNFFLDRNPFGYSARRIGDLYCGMVKDSYAKWKHLRDAPHNHNPVSDALGNAQALLKMKKMGLKIDLR